jgi:hypothetical protein
MAEKTNLKDKIAEGAVLARLIFEVYGKPKEHVEKTLSLMVDKFKEMKDIKILKQKFFDPKEVEGMWTNFMELDIIFKDIGKLIDMVIDYLPSSVEIIEPENLNVNSTDFSGVLNDLSVKMINMSNEYSKAKTEKDIIKRKINTLMSINIIRALKEPKTKKELSDELRVEEDDLEPFLADLTKTVRVKLKDGKYHLE